MNDDKTQQLLLDAIEKNDIAKAKMLTLHVGVNGESLPLHFAAKHGRVEIMTMLVDAGANINAVDKSKRTACHIATSRNQFDALKLLIERGANLGGVDSNGFSLLWFVSHCDRSERLASLLLDAGAPIDGLSNGLVMKLVKSVAMFNRLVARGVNLTAMRDAHHATLCHHVARNVRCEDDLRVLFDACGNDAVRAVDDDGKTPLQWASSNGNELAVRVLVELGADIDRWHKDGRTALFAAAVGWNPRASFVELLVALGADVSLVDWQGETACHIAAGVRQNVGLCALVAAGGDLDQPNNNGQTPRMITIVKNIRLPTADEIDAARRRIAKTRLDLVRERAFQICLGLQPLDFNALQLCEIMIQSFGALGSLIAFHQWWAIATKVKHFRENQKQ